ncbi:MAG: L-histidine N(alpha)-methyltransferase [Cyclobacteriaceae bacterium]
MIETKTYDQTVVRTIEKGLTSNPKRLPSWLFYDEVGDKIFQAIMRMPEYYLTDCEHEILCKQKSRIGDLFSKEGNSFKLVELGAGDGTKTEVLLDYFTTEDINFTYVPVDVSKAVLDQLQKRLKITLPDLKVHSENKLYQEALTDLNANDEERKVILFLGANIGNFSVSAAEDFVQDLAANMHSNDLLLIGFDLKKDPRLILAAYDDKGGITKEFNLNLLARLNRDLGARFDLEKFSHYPFYDPETGVTKSYLISQANQNVFIEALDRLIVFNKWEIIHTEVSQKYDAKMIERLADHAGLEVVEKLYDERGYFCDVVMRLK